MTLTELRTEVYNLTNRPDLTTVSTAAVKAATLKAHRLDFFSKDIYERGVQWPSTSFVQSLDYMTFIPNWRKLKYLRRVTDENDAEGTFFTILTVDELLDAYGNNKTDIVYNAGRVLEIRAAVTFKYALLGAYVLPIVTDARFSSWIADMNPYAIIYEAARSVLIGIGSLEEARGFNKLLKRDPKKPGDPPGEYDLLVMDNISTIGY